MNILQLYATRGVKLFINMPSEDMLDGMRTVPFIYNQYLDAANIAKDLERAIEYRQQCESNLEEAEAELATAKEQGIEYDVKLTKDVDAYLKQIQTNGSFLADGVSIVPGFVIPQINLTELYAKIETDSDVDNYTDQIKAVIPDAEEKVAECKDALADAREMERQTVNTGIYKMLYMQI